MYAQKPGYTWSLWRKKEPKKTRYSLFLVEIHTTAEQEHKLDSLAYALSHQHNWKINFPGFQWL